MPLHEYRCERCRQRFEVLQRMGAGADGLECPSCGWASVEREASSFASARGSGGSGCAPRGRFT